MESLRGKSRDETLRARVRSEKQLDAGAKGFKPRELEQQMARAAGVSNAAHAILRAARARSSRENETKREREIDPKARRVSLLTCGAAHATIGRLLETRGRVCVPKVREIAFAS